ncbi:SOS-response transcriptional repressors (RecA-mediated autopeptidase) [Hahella chejuensis KCTC 2396]|uniref:SOS-response transcriptional repressors (RecA-mediated autopeptidase) n=2 Tax=Hahella chejuensis TaxID=158327 RepID=Q2SPC6_HAHCH|nr:SOS-response transcriptional repressors (RecA-mediated autopeptidase) [Hahella chejuensis KCTC 2396]
MVRVSHVTISQWEKGETSPRGENLHLLCSALSCQPDWLLYGKAERAGDEKIAGYQPYASLGKVPLITPQQARVWKEIANTFHHKDAIAWRGISVVVGPHAFAMKAVGDSMANPHGTPSIPEGAIVVVDPDITPVSGMVVVVGLKGSKEAIIKKLVVDGPNQYLMSLNPDYKPIELTEESAVIGVVKRLEFDLLPD